MKVYNFKDLTKQKISEICSRSIPDDMEIENRIKQIIVETKTYGDEALINYAAQFDKVRLPQLYIDRQSIEKLASEIPVKVKKAVNTAYQNIYKFHAAQLQKENGIETMKGVYCWRENRAIEKVGLYIPGGTAVLPSTFLMLGIPAKIAGCKEIVVCSPPQKNGTINCCIAYIATLLQIDKIYLIGGAQAIAAMAYGTASVPKVNKIFGPGNRYVTGAKKALQNVCAIDMPAGPSEVLVIADESANPCFVASDLLAQAEHGIDSQAILVSNSLKMIDDILKNIETQIIKLPRHNIARQAIANSYAVYTQNIEQAIAFSNLYAPEHLILAAAAFEKLIPLITNAGSVFLGNFTPESAGDYATGTNHTLPTSGFASAFSGVSVDTFLKKITFQHINQEGLKNIGSTVATLANAEGLQAHKNAINIRLANLD